LGLETAAVERLSLALMTERWDEPGQVAAWLVDECSLPAQRAQRAAMEVWRQQESEATPIPGAYEAVASLRSAGYRLGIISNIWHPYLVGVRHHFGALLDEMAKHGPQLYSYREGLAKPDIELYRRALDMAGCSAASAVMVGDSYEADIGPALTVGMGTVWVLHRPDEEKPFLVQVLNGGARMPSRTVSSITQVMPRLVAEMKEQRTGVVGRVA
jgi:FMN phosphatase YigB (HAD superfamily)